MAGEEVGEEGPVAEEALVGEGGPVIQGMLLRKKLVEFRRGKDMIQEEVARRLEWHTSKLIRIEGGKTGVRKTDLVALLDVYGVGSEERERMERINRAARADAWWKEFKDDVGDSYLSYVGYEAGASLVRQFQPLAVPGLLQTRSYAETLIMNDANTARSKRRVDLRLRRQRELSEKEAPPRQLFVLDEAVIHRHVGIKKDRSIMPDQLRHIIDVVEKNDHVVVVLIPYGAGAHPGMRRGAFTILDLKAGLGKLLHLESGAAESTVIGDDPRIGDYQSDFETIWREALSPEESMTHIRSVADGMA